MRLIALLFVVAIVAASADPFAAVRTMIKNDECSINRMEEIRPQIEQQLQLLQENKNNLEAKAELIALIQKAKAVSVDCDLNNKIQPALGDIVEATGVGFLLLSNCSKDIGIVFLLLDSVIQAPTDWVNDVMIAIFGAILGKQGYKDCSQFINFIVG